MAPGGFSIPVNCRSGFACARTVMARAALAMGLVSFVLTAAAEKAAPDITKVGTWMVGTQLGLAAIVYFRNNGSHEKFFDEAKSRAKEIGIAVKDFPPRPAKSSDGLIAMLEYFNKGDGALIGSELRRKYGAYHSTLYDVAAHLFQMPLFYDLDPQLGDKLSQSMRTNCTKIRLPDRLWKPVADAIAQRKSFEEVRSSAVQMDKDVTDYLVKAARGEEK
jgi:hypothetical protein